MAGNFIDVQAPSGFILDLSERNPPKVVAESVKEQRQEDLEFTSGLTPEELEGLTDSNGVAFEDISVSPLTGKDVFETALKVAKTPEELEAAYRKKEEWETVLRDTENLTSIDYLLATDPKAGHELLRQEHLTNTARNQLISLAEEYSKGTFDTGREFLQQMIDDSWYGMTHPRELLTGKGSYVQKLSEEYVVALNTMSSDEFAAFFQDRLDSIRNGVWEEPAFRVYQELQAIDSAGMVLWDDKNAFTQGVFGVIDIATAGLSGASVGAKGLKTVYGRARSSVGTRRATKLAEESPVVTGKPVPPVREAAILDDIAPTGVATTVKAANIPNAPPISITRTTRQSLLNKHIEKLKERWKNGYGSASLSDNAFDWAVREATTLSSALKSRYIDYTFVDRGLENYSVVATLGKEGGTPWKTVKAAQRAVQDLSESPEWASVRIVDSRTGKPVDNPVGKGEYVVMAERLVPLEEVKTAMDLSKTSPHHVANPLAYVTSTAIGTNGFYNNVAHGALAGHQGFLKDTSKWIKRIAKTGRKEVSRIDSILTELRDTPVGKNERTWYDTATFVQEYVGKYSENPTRQVLEAYQELVEMSNFSWYVMANQRLSKLADLKATLVTISRVDEDDMDIFAFPLTNRTTPNPNDLVWDASGGPGKAFRTLDPNATVLRLERAMPDGSKYVTNFGNTRVPDLEDAFPYNAGGPRTNPEVLFYVGNSDDNWATLLGAKSEKDANAAVAQFNTVADEAARLSPTGSPVSAADKLILDDFVRANRDWNTNLEDWDDWVKFTEERGVPWHKRVHPKARDADLTDVAPSFEGMPVSHYTSYHRHDHALLEYGGGNAANPGSVEAIAAQYGRMSSQAAQTQYVIQHVGGWVKAVEQAVNTKKLSNPGVGLGPASDIRKVLEYQIDTTSDLGKKLRQEQRVIQRRLKGFTGTDWLNRTSETVNALVHDQAKLLPGEKAGKGIESITRWFNKNITQKLPEKALSIGFYLKMADPSQMFLQSSHFIPMTAIDPVNTPKALTLATVLKQSADAPASSWEFISKQLAKISFIKEDELIALTEHLRISGRGHMRGAVAEDPSGRGSKIGHIISTPFYLGENYSNTVSRISAFLHARSKRPDLPLDSDEFWHMVHTQDRKLSFDLTRSQRSSIQGNAIASVLSQWTSYPLRTLEKIFLPSSGFTKGERLRVAGATTILWGTAGLGIHSAIGSDEELGEEQAIWANIMVNGLDVLFDEALGIKVGSRVSFGNPIELWSRGLGTFTNASDHAPVFATAGATALDIVDVMVHVFTAPPELTLHSVDTLVRQFKFVDNVRMAYTMAMHDVRRSNSGVELRGNFTKTQAVMQALGLTPSEAIELYQASGQRYKNSEYRQEALEKGSHIAELAVQAAEKGDLATAKKLLLDTHAAVSAYGLTEVRHAEVMKSIINRLGNDRVSWLSLELMKDGYNDLANRINQGFTE